MKVSLFEHVPYRFLPTALVPVAYAAEFGGRMAGSQVVLIDDCGHAMQADQPARTWAAISTFLPQDQ